MNGSGLYLGRFYFEILVQYRHDNEYGDDFERDCTY